jgi:hypothetical protein
VSARDVARAARLFGESLTLWIGAQDVSGVATSLEGLARVADARRDPAIVLELLAAAEVWRRTHSAQRSDADRNICDHLIATARAELAAAVAEAAWTEGASRPLEETVARARGLFDSSSA